MIIQTILHHSSSPCPLFKSRSSRGVGSGGRRPAQDLRGHSAVQGRSTRGAAAGAARRAHRSARADAAHDPGPPAQHHHAALLRHYRERASPTTDNRTGSVRSTTGAPTAPSGTHTPREREALISPPSSTLHLSSLRDADGREVQGSTHHTTLSSPLYFFLPPVYSLATGS